MRAGLVYPAIVCVRLCVLGLAHDPVFSKCVSSRLCVCALCCGQVDVAITEGANEAKDNVKYLATLEKFVDPLYIGDPVSIVDTLPALLNSLKMIHTIAR